MRAQLTSVTIQILEPTFQSKTIGIICYRRRPVRSQQDGTSSTFHQLIFVREGNTPIRENPDNLDLLSEDM